MKSNFTQFPKLAPHASLLADGSKAQPTNTLFLALGGPYTAAGLCEGYKILPMQDQLYIRQLVRRFAPWLKSRGLINQEQFVELWKLHAAIDRTQQSHLSRARLEYLLGRITRTNEYTIVRSNALFMFALGLGIHPRHAYSLRMEDIKAIRNYLVTNKCYTQWAWMYIDKLIEKRSIVRGTRGRRGWGGQNGETLFLNMDGSNLYIATARVLCMGRGDNTGTGWKAMYGLSVRDTMIAHRTMATEFAGKQLAINQFYKEIFKHNVKWYKRRHGQDSQDGFNKRTRGVEEEYGTDPRRRKGDTANDPTIYTTNNTLIDRHTEHDQELYAQYWDCTQSSRALKSRIYIRKATPAQVLIERTFISTKWLAARRDYAVRRAVHIPYAKEGDTYVIHP